jgi:predicted P-loop ATPase
VEIEQIDANHGVDMDMVYSQAYHLLKTGYRYWFDTVETAAVNDSNKNFTVQTTEDELVQKYCVADKSWITATEVAKDISEIAKYPFGK